MKTKETSKNTKIIILNKRTFEINNKTKRTHMMKMSSSLLFKLLPLLVYLITITILQQMTMMIICVNGLTVGVENPTILLNADTNTNTNNANNNERHQSVDTMSSIEIMKMMNAKHQEEGFDKISGNNLQIEQQQQKQPQHITMTNNERMKNFGDDDDDGYGINNAMKDAKMSSPSTVPEKDKEEILITTSSYNPAIESKSVLIDSTLGNELSFNSNAKRNVGNNDISSSSSSNILLQNNENNDEIFECGSPQNLHKGKFTGYDYAIVLAMLIISLGIGAFYGFFHKSNSGSNPDSSNEFLLGTQMSTFTVTLSLTTSFITAIELLGNPSEMFYQGTQFSLIVIPMVLVIPVATKIFYPIYYKLDLTSCYEYLGIRFGKDLRIMGAVLYIIQMSFYTAVAVLAPAIALSKATGLNTRLAVALIYIVCVFYSSQGGMKAVVIADTFQACVLAGSLVLIVILGTYYTGNAITIFETASEHNRLEFFNFDPNPTTRHTVFSVVIGGFFYWASLFCTNQASVQKCMSLKSLIKAKLALIFAIIGLIIVFLINFYTGLMVFTHYSKCDPLSSGQIEATDQLLPFYIMNVYGNIYTITGIFVAGIFAASLGTVASALNSLAAVTCEDILVNGFNIKLRPEKGAMYAKWMSLGYGVFSFILVFVVERLGGVLQATLTLNGLIGGVTLGLFVLGIVFKRANAKGAFYGGVIALMFVIYIGVMAQITNVDPKPLSKSIEECNCFVSNKTLYYSSSSDGLDFLNNNDNNNNNIVEMEAKYRNVRNGDDNEKIQQKIILNEMMPTTTITTNVVVSDSLVNPTTTKMIIEKNILMIGDKIMNYDDNSNDNNHINNVNENYENNNSYNNNDNITTNNNNSNSNNRSDYYHGNHIGDRLGRIIDDTLNKNDNDQGFSFSSIYRISYMWYSMIGALLTISFGLIISIIYDKINEHRILKITKRNQQKENHCYDNNDIKMNTTSNCYGNISNGGNYNRNDTNQNYDVQQQNMYTSKLNENLRLAHSNKQTSISQTCTSDKSDCGIDNYALKIDDEK